MRVKLRMQMNVVLDENQALDRARHFNVIFPVFWFEAGIDSLPVEVVGKLQMAQNIPPVVKTTSVAVCLFFTVLFLVLLLAHTVAGWCGALSPQNSRAASPEDLPSNFAAAYPQCPPGAESLTPSYKSSELSSTIDDQATPPNMVDTHTMPPPYKKNSNRIDEPDSPYEINNYRPPSYSAVTAGVQNSSSTVSAEIHTTQSEEEETESPLVVEKNILPQPNPSAPSPDKPVTYPPIGFSMPIQYVDHPQSDSKPVDMQPLASSSPQDCSPNVSTGDDNAQSLSDSIPSQRPSSSLSSSINRKSSTNLPPPLESDL